MKRTGNSKVAVVGWGRGMGHTGHMYLADAVITQAGAMKADPYFFVSKTVGKDDPLYPEEKLAIYKKVFPQYANIFTPEANLNQALQELAKMGYQGIVLVVGADQKEAFKYLEKPNKEGVPVYQSFGFKKLKVISRQETRSKFRGEEGPRATPMRQVLLDPNATDEQKFEVWRRDMPSALSDDEVMDLMRKAAERLSVTNKPKSARAKDLSAKISKLKEAILSFRTKAKPVQKKDDSLGYKHLFKQPGEAKKPEEKRFHGWQEYEKQPQTVEENRIIDPKALINAYYVSPKGARHKVAEKIPYYLLDKLIPLLTKKYAITMHDIEVRPSDITQYKRSSQPELAEGLNDKPEAGDKITWYYSNQYPKIEGEVVGWKEGHLIVKSIDPSPRNTEKTVTTYRVPKNNILSVEKQGMDESIFDRFKKKPAQPEVADPGNYPRIGADIAQWMADTVEYHKAKFPDTVWKLFCPTYPDYLPVRVRVGTSEKIMHQHLDDYINLRNQNPEAVRMARQKFDKNNTYPSGPRDDYTNKVTEQGVSEGYGEDDGIHIGAKVYHREHQTGEPFKVVKIIDDQRVGVVDDYGNKKVLFINQLVPAQGVDEAYDGFGKFDAAEFQRHMEKLRAREELRKTDPMRALVGDLKDQDAEKELAAARRKKPEDDSIGINDPRHPGYAYTQMGQTDLNEFAPGNGDDKPTAEYEVYQCQLDDQFDWIGGPLMQTDDMGKAHSFAYFLWKKHPDKCFMIWQERSQGSRGGYGPEGSVLAPSKEIEEAGITRRGILKGLAGAGALGAASKASAIAGAFPSPSTREKWAKDAAASNAAEARRQAELKAKADKERLAKNTPDVERLNKVSYHGKDSPQPSNATWDGDSSFLDLDGTQYAMASRMPIRGDIPPDMKLIVTQEGRQVYIWTRNGLTKNKGHYFYPAENPKTIDEDYLDE